MIEWADATAAYSCGESAGGSSLTCVDSQRLPSMMKADAVTYGHFIFCEPSCDSVGLLSHEIAHVRQWELNGDWFAVSYLWHSGDGYRGNPYEVEAYDVQAFMAAWL